MHITTIVIQLGFYTKVANLLGPLGPLGPGIEIIRYIRSQ
jgi:hypothetical protein